MKTQALGKKGTDSEQLKVKCLATEEEWYLSCFNQKWTGHVGNCSEIPKHRPGNDAIN